MAKPVTSTGATVNIDELLKPSPNIQAMPSAFPDGPASAPPLASLSDPIVSQLQRKYQLTPNASSVFITSQRPGGPGPSGTGAGFFTPVQGEPSSSFYNAAPLPIRQLHYQLGVLPKPTPESNFTPTVSHGVR